VRDLLFVGDARTPRPLVTIREQQPGGGSSNGSASAGGGGVALSGAVEREVRCAAEMAALLEQGTLCRAVAATAMNERSSRSHALLTLTLEQRRCSAPDADADADADGGEGGGDANGDGGGTAAAPSEEEDGNEYLIAKMHLVDLAGSERAKRTGASGARLKEAININKVNEGG
jgi:kinesin family protein 4/21/27